MPRRNTPGAATAGGHVFRYLRLNSGSTTAVDITSTSTVATRWGFSPSSTLGDVLRFCGQRLG